MFNVAAWNLNLVENRRQVHIQRQRCQDERPTSQVVGLDEGTIPKAMYTFLADDSRRNAKSLLRHITLMPCDWETRSCDNV